MLRDACVETLMLSRYVESLADLLLLLGRNITCDGDHVWQMDKMGLCDQWRLKWASVPSNGHAHTSASRIHITFFFFSNALAITMRAGRSTLSQEPRSTLAPVLASATMHSGSNPTSPASEPSRYVGAEAPGSQPALRISVAGSMPLRELWASIASASALIRAGGARIGPKAASAVVAEKMQATI